MHQVAIEDAGPQLAALVREAQNGEEVILTQDNAPVARLTLVGGQAQTARRLGTAAGQVWMAPDWDELGEEWAEYM